MAEIMGVRLGLTVGEVEGAVALPNYVHAEVESHKVLGRKVDSGHLKFEKIINSNEIILG